MSWQEELTNKISAYAAAEFEYIETTDIRRTSDIDNGCTGIYMEATVIFFEIKNWLYMVEEQGRRKMAKSYTMLQAILDALAKQNGAFVNCCASNGFLIVFPGDDSTYNTAIKYAMKVAYAITETYKKEFTEIGGIEFAMGMDHGHIMGTKNPSDTDMEHITWIGKCIYKANRIVQECARPFYIGISSRIYHTLGEDLRVSYRRILGIKKSVDVWTKVTIYINNIKKHLYQTNFKMPIDKDEL